MRAAKLTEAPDADSHCLDQLLEVERRAHFAFEARFLFSRVPELVLPAGGDEDDVARFRQKLLAVDLECQRALEDFERRSSPPRSS